MTREALHQFRVGLASVLLCLAALLQLQWLDFPGVHPGFVFLAAILLFPGALQRRGSKPSTSFIPIALIIGINILSTWWHARTGQALRDLPWFIGATYLFCLFAMTHGAAQTIRLEPRPDIADSGKTIP